MAGMRKLSTLQMDKDLKDQLARAELKTVKDVLTSSHFGIMEMLRLSSEECTQLLNRLYKTCLPPHTNALDMLEKEKKGAIRLGCNQLDAMLHGGLHFGSVTEFAGPPGVGKTQWCTYASVLSVMPKGHGGCEKSVIYIDTEKTFRSERVIEILSSKYPECEDVAKYLSMIYVYQPSTIDSLSKIINSLGLLNTEKDVGVIIVDSIASLVRKEIAPSSVQSNIMRVEQLASWVAKLKSVAQQRSICVIVTNQITTRINKDVKLVTEDFDGTEFEETGVQSEIGVGSARYHVMPALGYSWTHFVNTRLILQYLSNTNRQMIIAKSPVAPVSSFSYLIGEWGIEIQESESAYSYAVCDSSRHRIKVQPGLPI